jgi:oxygen-dependent protoporphyrinogen oxidase
MNKKITILGAGISGLATAWLLHKEGFDVTILEKESTPGGTMQSMKENGYLIDLGPNSGLETTPLIRTLVNDAGISDELIYANEQGNKRYILKNNALHALPTGARPFMKTSLFSTRAKLRLLLEPLIGKSSDGYYQSIAEFVTRRLGKEFLDYAINPFVAGVFAGDPAKLSVKSAFPKLYRLEEEYGGLIKGMIKGAKERKKSTETSKQSAKMFSFRNGMNTFPEALASKLNEKVIYNADVKSIEKSADGYSISYIHESTEKQISSDIVLSTIPAYIASDIFRPVDSGLSEHLSAVYYPPVMVLFAGYNKNAIGKNLDGFGFLIPEKEKKSYLGAIWSSVIFEGRNPADQAAFTIFIGGSRSPELFEMDSDELIEKVLSEFQGLMGINEKPVFVKSKFWKKAIPQYELGYIEHVRYFEKFENENPGLFLSGNFVGGISVGDCIKNSDTTFQKIKRYIDQS